MSKSSVYIAGPMTGYESLNYPAFNAAEKYLRSLGFDEVGNPAAMSGDDKLHVVSPHADGSGSNRKAFKDLFRGDLLFLCDNATHIFMLKGWEKSHGARAEHAVAHALGLEIIYQTSF